MTTRVQPILILNFNTTCKRVVSSILWQLYSWWKSSGIHSLGGWACSSSGLEVSMTCSRLHHLPYSCWGMELNLDISHSCDVWTFDMFSLLNVNVAHINWMSILCCQPLHFPNSGPSGVMVSVLEQFHLVLIVLVSWCRYECPVTVFSLQWLKLWNMTHVCATSVFFMFFVVSYVTQSCNLTLFSHSMFCCLKH